MNSRIIMDDPGNARHADLSQFGDIPESHFPFYFSLLFFCYPLFSHWTALLVTEGSVARFTLSLRLILPRKECDFPNKKTFFQNFPESSTSIRVLTSFCRETWEVLHYVASSRHL